VTALLCDAALMPQTISTLISVLLSATAPAENLVRNECIYVKHAKGAAELRVLVAVPISFRRTDPRTGESLTTDLVRFLSLWCPLDAGGRAACFGAVGDLGQRGNRILGMDPMDKNFNATEFRVVGRNAKSKVMTLESAASGRILWSGDRVDRRQRITVDFGKQHVVFSSHLAQSSQTEDEQGEADCAAHWLQEPPDGRWKHLVRPPDPPLPRRP